MQRTVDSSFEDVDAVLFVLDARDRIGSGDRFIAKRVFELGVPVVIVVNKVDRLKPGHIASQMQTASQLGDFHALHPVSAKTGDGVAAAAGRAGRALAGWPCLLSARSAHGSLGRGADRRARAREGDSADPGRGAALGHGGGGGDRGQGRPSRGLRRDRLAEADPRRQGWRDGARDRDACAPGDRGAARAARVPGARRQGAAEVATGRADVERLGL